MISARSLKNSLAALPKITTAIGWLRPNVFSAAFSFVAA
jgi:hypothetical protein